MNRPARNYLHERLPLHRAAALRRLAKRVLVAVLVAGCLVLAPSAAMAKKDKEVEVPKKSYVMPYMIVLMMVSVGLMTVCRPDKRKDRPDEKRDEEA